MEEVDGFFLLQDFTDILEEFPLVQSMKDVCYWSNDADEGFTVKSYAQEIRKKRGMGCFRA